MNRDLTDDEVWHWLEMACMADDVHKFPQNINTPLGEWGLNLSGGQIQRIGLARGLSYNPYILLIDDGLSAVGFAKLPTNHIMLPLWLKNRS